MAERSMAVVLKTTEPETVPGVRIPLSPPDFALLDEHIEENQLRLFLSRIDADGRVAVKASGGRSRACVGRPAFSAS